MKFKANCTINWKNFKNKRYARLIITDMANLITICLMLLRNSIVCVYPATAKIYFTVDNVLTAEKDHFTIRQKKKIFLKRSQKLTLH